MLHDLKYLSVAITRLLDGAGAFLTDMAVFVQDLDGKTHGGINFGIVRCSAAAGSYFRVIGLGKILAEIRVSLFDCSVHAD